MGFRLKNNQYEEIQLNNQGWRWSQELELYLGVDENQLRYFTANGERVPTPQEAAIQEQLVARQAQLQAQQAESQVQQAESQAQQAQLQVQQERERAERLAQRLRELGIDPEQ